MNCNALLYWLTYLEQGSWSRFRGAVASISPSEGEQEKISRDIRIRLSDLGHVDFFIKGSQRWQICPPILAGLCGWNDTAFLCGARSPKLVSLLERAAATHGCSIHIREIIDAPSAIFIKGEHLDIQSAAKLAGVIYIPDFSASLCRGLASILNLYDAAIRQDEPSKWKLKSFDLKSGKWVEERLPESACEYTSSFGERRYFVCDKRGRLKSMPKREAVYASAALQEAVLAEYDWPARKLTTSASAPLPELFTRAACLSGGKTSRIERGRLLYEDVPPLVATALLTLAGQPYPKLPMP